MLRRLGDHRFVDVLTFALAMVALLVLGRRLVLDYVESRGAFALARVEKTTLLLLQPRGLVSAVLAIEAARLGLDPRGTFLGIASLVILLTNGLLILGARVAGSTAPAGRR